jgi:hypothetical protein
MGSEDRVEEKATHGDLSDRHVTTVEELSHGRVELGHNQIGGEGEGEGEGERERMRERVMQ